jgi:hypothetical protein
VGTHLRCRPRKHWAGPWTTWAGHHVGRRADRGQLHRARGPRIAQHGARAAASWATSGGHGTTDRAPAAPRRAAHGHRAAGGGRTIAAHGPRPAGHRATSWAHGPRPADLVPGAARSGAPGAAHAPSLAGGHGGRITPKKVTNRRPAVIPGEKKPATRAGGQAGGRLMRACLQRRPAGPASARPCPWRRPGRR